MIEEQIFTTLTTDSEMAALISDRVYPLILPQGAALPAVTYQRISTPRLRSHSGPSGLAHPRYQLSCWAQRYDQAREVADRLRRMVDGRRGVLGEVSLVADDRDGYDPESGLFRRIVELVLWHRE